MANSFKFTFPILKAESRADGLYLVGLASGPEVDSDGERIAPEAITRFAAQIEERVALGDPLPYRDAHAPDGVLMELGTLVKAWVDEHFHLGVEVKLDSANPASQYLYEQVRRGKQYGMSVSGRVLEWADEFVSELGKSVRTFKNVILDEISNTTRPAWYPSFGTVLAKSVSGADSSSAPFEGESASMDDELHGDENVAVTEDEEASTTEEEATPEGEAAPEAEEEESDLDVDKAGRSISAKNREGLLALYQEFGQKLVELGVLDQPEETDSEADKSAPVEESDTISKAVQEAVTEAVAPLAARNEELTAQLVEANDRIAALESAPRTQLPGAITDGTKKTAKDEFGELLSKATPFERLQIAFAAQHGEGVVN